MVAQRYPVGRLDRETTGLLLITNDGELANKLTHPSHQVQKQYRVGSDRPVSQRDLERIAEGVELEDGMAQVNWIRYAEDHPGRDVVELEISEGRNRIVRRIFESLGYDVRKLDRFYFAGLTKKDLPRGAFRELTQREIIMLKHFTGKPKGELVVGTALAATEEEEIFDDELDETTEIFHDEEFGVDEDDFDEDEMEEEEEDDSQEEGEDDFNDKFKGGDDDRDM
jgi:pseudouridine synthase